MTATAEFTKEEIVQRGKEIYQRDIRRLIEAGDDGRVEVSQAQVHVPGAGGGVDLVQELLDLGLRLRPGSAVRATATRAEGERGGDADGGGRACDSNPRHVHAPSIESQASRVGNRNT